MGPTLNFGMDLYFANNSLKTGSLSSSFNLETNSVAFARIDLMSPALGRLHDETMKHTVHAVQKKTFCLRIGIAHFWVRRQCLETVSNNNARESHCRCQCISDNVGEPSFLRLLHRYSLLRGCFCTVRRFLSGSLTF